MTVQDELRTVTVPRQGGPADAVPPLPPAPAPEPAAPLLGRDRPLTTDERHFLVGMAVVVTLLSTYIVTFLLLSERVWS